MIQASRDLKEKISVAEQRLWEYFRDGRFCNLQFKRQFVIDSYIVNFISLESKLIIELVSEPLNKEYDARKIEHLKKLGYKVVRFWNHDILHNIRVVLEVIHDEVDKAVVKL